MNAPNFAGLAADFREGVMTAALRRADDALLRSRCRLIGEREGRESIKVLASSIDLLGNLTAPEMLLLVTVLASKVRESSADYSDAIADAMEVELPNALWAITDDESDDPEES